MGSPNILEADCFTSGLQVYLRDILSMKGGFSGNCCFCLPFFADVPKPEGEVVWDGVHSLVYCHQTFNTAVKSIT